MKQLMLVLCWALTCWQMLAGGDVAIVLMASAKKNGVRVHALASCDILAELGLTPVLVAQEADVAAQCYARSRNIPFVGTKSYYPAEVADAIRTVAATYPGAVRWVFANTYYDVQAAAQVRAVIPAPCFYTVHFDSPPWLAATADADEVVCVNYLTYANLLAKLPAKADRLYFCQPCFDERPYQDFVPTQSRAAYFERLIGRTLAGCFVCAVVASFTPHKNHPVVFDALKILVKEKGLPICVVLAGEGALRERYEKMIREEGFEDHIFFAGHLDDVRPLLYHSDVVINPSLSEPFGLAAMEAGLLSKPLIATRGTGTTVFAKHEHTALVVDSRDPRGFAHAVIRLLGDALLREQLGSALQHVVLQRFARASTKQFYASLLHAVQAPHHAPHTDPTAEESGDQHRNKAIPKG